MKNKLVYLLFSFILIVSLNVSGAEQQQPNNPNLEAVEVGNLVCPVTGAKIESMGPVIKHQYKGKIYNLCCPGCVGTFDKDPQKYSAIAYESVSSKMSGQEMENHEKNLKPAVNDNGEISYYTCGMHPSVRVTVENYKKGDTKCPICFMPLTPVKADDAGNAEFGEDVVSKVTVKAEELKLAGIKREAVKRRILYKEIRAVGKVAYDPQLAVAQDEFVSSVKSYESAQNGGALEIVERARSLVESSKRKLQLFGLSTDQIKLLERTKSVQQNLVLPEDKMWIYGDVFEYELNWVKVGAYVKVTAIGLAGDEFYGQIVSINPVVDSQTRSVRFRALVDNSQLKLKPEMYVDVEIASEYTDSEGNKNVLSIPKTALLDTGRRRIVWVDKGNGEFEGRLVEVGPESIDHSSSPTKYYPVLKGVRQGELVVTKGNFLLDSQSQITGVVSSAYSGTIGSKENQESGSDMPGHVH
ncbi:MAG: efflux RND transporter periplasmic adaptor subunit [Candidatus Omnitrophica bacterium]|nr:efflux RND transporter periplasmic adaptor subunit [Candidatus Omnitrophota bacterium]